VGLTGSVTKALDGFQTRVYDRVISIAGPDGSGAVGVDGVALGGGGSLQMIVTSAGPGPLPPGLPPDVAAAAKKQLGNVMRLTDAGAIAKIANIDHVEFQSNPDGRQIDSDPYGLAVLRGTKLAVDAAGNDVLTYDDHGNVSVLAVIPGRTISGHFVDSVPTSITMCGDGDYYVGTLGGDGTPLHGAQIWKVTTAGTASVAFNGLDNVVGIACHGNSLYAAELTNAEGNFGAPGAIVKINIGTGAMHDITHGAFSFIGGVAVNDAGTKLAFSTGALFPGGGSLLSMAA
jgi:hypothetical protein